MGVPSEIGWLQRETMIEHGQSKQLVRHTLAGRPPRPPVAGPLAVHYCAGLAGVSLPTTRPIRGCWPIACCDTTRGFGPTPSGFRPIRGSRPKRWGRGRLSRHGSAHGRHGPAVRASAADMDRIRPRSAVARPLAADARALRRLRDAWATRYSSWPASTSIRSRWLARCWAPSGR